MPNSYNGGNELMVEKLNMFFEGQFMSTVSPVFHNIETVRIDLKFI